MSLLSKLSLPLFWRLSNLRLLDEEREAVGADAVEAARRRGAASFGSSPTPVTREVSSEAEEEVWKGAREEEVAVVVEEEEEEEK
jgi:hypothetical protein